MIRFIKAKHLAYILILTLITFSAFPLLAQDCIKSQIKGENDAENRHSSAGWMAGGVGSGLLLGLIGTGIITAIAATSNPTPSIIPEKEDINLECYINGYKKVAKKKNTIYALSGGLIGTLVLVTIYFAAID